MPIYSVYVHEADVQELEKIAETKGYKNINALIKQGLLGLTNGRHSRKADPYKLISKHLKVLGISLTYAMERFFPGIPADSLDADALEEELRTWARWLRSKGFKSLGEADGYFKDSELRLNARRG